MNRLEGLKRKTVCGEEPLITHHVANNICVLRRNGKYGLGGPRQWRTRDLQNMLAFR